MFDVIVDSKIMGVRENAQKGNVDSMVLLATYIRRGWHTRQNPDMALKILDHVLADRDAIPFPETLWNALAQKAYIHFDRGEYETVDTLFTDLIRDMVKHPVERWEYDKMEEIMRWFSGDMKASGADATE